MSDKIENYTKPPVEIAKDLDDLKEFYLAILPHVFREEGIKNKNNRKAAEIAFDRAKISLMLWWEEEYKYWKLFEKTA